VNKREKDELAVIYNHLLLLERHVNELNLEVNKLSKDFYDWIATLIKREREKK